MSVDVTPYRASLERWSPTLFLVAGCLVLGHAAFMGLQAFTGVATPADVFAPAGHLAALVGLLGLAPALAARQPALTRGATAASAVSVAGWVVVTARQGAIAAGVVAPSVEVLPGAFFALVLVSTVLTYVLFGVAALRAGGEPRRVGALVLVPAVLLVALLSVTATTGASAVAGLVVGSGLALADLALGYALRPGGLSRKSSSTGDVTAS